MGYFLYKFNNEKIVTTEENERLSHQINQLENEVNTLKETNDNSSYNTKSVNLNTSNQKSTNETVSTNKMSIELAYGVLNKYKNENLSDDRWYITDVKLVAHGDNDTYLVSYSDYNLDGYEEAAETIIEYKNGKWTTDLPGFTGISDEEMSKYNFVHY